mmetsp:Transcript_29435/g.44927  ORF Transcript_29435/g.44927 Transcript_29435/m.44927 type:complete len:533 (-) Transcript_29435:134-1732(-)
MSTIAAPFSFHCVICIEAFNHTDRPPVVLPCGHTFICELCSKRIKSCFECRTSLFIAAPATNGSGNGHNNAHANGCPSPITPVSRRTGGYQGHTRYAAVNGAHNLTPTNKRPPPVERIPLPLPRNHVLLSLMEASQKRNKASKNPIKVYGSDQCSILDGDSSDDEEDGGESDNDEDVLNSINALSNRCGTYIVKDRFGLPVYETACRDYDDFGNNSSVPSTNPIMVLKHGERVQIVDAEDGVYWLARKSGVVYANSMQLLKVGVAKERSCKLEGMINSLQSSRANHSQKINDLLHAETNLRSELDFALSRPSNHPVIEQSIEMQIKQTEEELCTHATISTSASTGMDVEVCSTNSFSSATSPPENTGTYLTQSTGNTHAIEISDGIQHIFSDESISTPTPATPPPLTTPRRVRKTYFYDTTPNSESGSPFRAGLMCGTSIFPLLRRLEDDDEHDNETRIPIRRTNSEDLPTRLLEKVDFRTGLSGHVALNRAHRHHHTSSMSRSHVRMMGEHRGIAAIKNMRKNKNAWLYSP